MNCGRVTNTRDELLALWCILFFACYKNVTRLQLVGDLKIIIDRFFNENNLQVFSLQPWMTKIRVLSGKFLKLKSQHIYQKYNKEADQRSKEAFLLDEDGIYYAVGT